MNNIKLSDYDYILPEEKIAKYGITTRDKAKLLKYENGEIEDHIFRDLADNLPAKSTLFFNDTKVVQARLFFSTNTGAKVEIFLLNPVDQTLSFEQAMALQNQAVFECIIGNLKRWKNHEILIKKINLNGTIIKLKSALIDRKLKHVVFSWQSTKINFFNIIEAIGHTPLPPYFNRPDIADDRQRYQTVYSKLPGAVAAPTAGLHFTDNLLDKIKEKGIHQEYLTLHVGAGTFQPIKSENVSSHPMHSEQIILTQKNLQAVISSAYIIAVGTTALRTLESAYWFGVLLLENNNSEFHIEKLLPYKYGKELPSKRKAFSAILDYMQSRLINKIIGHTEIFILPGYKFRVCNGLITNFHQPGSTLILLIAAFVGENWQKIYRHALSSDYNFLSYGDSSLLLRPNNEDG